MTMKRITRIIVILVTILPAFIANTAVYAQQVSDSYSIIDNIGWKNGFDVPDNVTESYAYNASTDELTTQVTFNRTGFAAIPPMLALAYKYGFPVTFSKPVEDTGTYSVFGPLMGFLNTSSYTYTITGLKKYVDGSFIQKQNQDVSDLQNKLNTEIDKILAAGHLSPAGFFNKAPGQPTGATGPTDVMWYNPAEQLYLLVETHQLLSSSKQGALNTYLQQEQAVYPAEMTFFMPLKEGTSRRYSPIPDNALDQYDSVFLTKSPHLWSVYGLSRYYQVTNTTPDSTQMTAINTLVEDTLQHLDWAMLYWQKGHQPSYNAVHGANQAFAGLAGYIRIARQTNDTQAETLGWGMFGKIAALRFAMGKYTQYQQDYGFWKLPSDPAWWAKQHVQEKFDYQGQYTWNGELITWDWSKPTDNVRQVHRLDEFGVNTWEWFDNVGDQKGAIERSSGTENKSPRFLMFADLTPELGVFLNDYLLPESRAYMQRVEENLPTWDLTYTQSVLGREAGLSMPYNAHDLFMAYAWVLDKTPDEVAAKIDVPWLPKVGDYYYIHKLTEAIKAYNYCWSVEGVSCVDGESNPIIGDLNRDSTINIQDIIILINEIFTPSGVTGSDINKDGKVDILDVIALINIIFS